MDLSKAFDCLSPDLLLLKLKRHRLSECALKLLKNYLSDRQQCVKLGFFKCNFQNISKDTPRPNTWTSSVQHICHSGFDCGQHNYVDNRTLASTDCCKKVWFVGWNRSVGGLLGGFSKNHMQANLGKFQALSVGENTKKKKKKKKKKKNENCVSDLKIMKLTVTIMRNFWVSYLILG